VKNPNKLAFGLRTIVDRVRTVNEKGDRVHGVSWSAGERVVASGGRGAGSGTRDGNFAGLGGPRLASRVSVSASGSGFWFLVSL